jgi:hypothetical protein
MSDLAPTRIATAGGCPNRPCASGLQDSIRPLTRRGQSRPVNDWQTALNTLFEGANA